VAVDRVYVQIRQRGRVVEKLPQNNDRAKHRRLIEMYPHFQNPPDLTFTELPTQKGMTRGIGAAKLKNRANLCAIALNLCCIAFSVG
jgi:hypothetical protein